MSSDLQCLDSTLIDSAEMLRSLPQHPCSPSLNHVFPYVAQAVAGLLQQPDPFLINRSNTHVETIAIRSIEPEYKFIITIEPLTNRELEVLQLIVEGYSNRAIAKKLYISVGTVKSHVRNILKKLCASDRTQAAIRALRSGLVH
jgi:DNA-binding NarL/FixJ family response regulator